MHLIDVDGDGDVEIIFGEADGTSTTYYNDNGVPKIVPNKSPPPPSSPPMPPVAPVTLNVLLVDGNPERIRRRAISSDCLHMRTSVSTFLESRR